MFMQIDNTIPTILLILFLSFIVAYLIRYGLGYIMKMRRDRIELQEQPLKTVTIVSCVNRDYTLEREFREGDFVGKIDGPCPKCNSNTVVEKIYVVPLSVKGAEKRG